MNITIWIIMLLCPIFIIVAVWTKLIKTISVKIIVTVLSAFLLFALVALWNLYGENQKANNTLRYAVDRDTNYIKCLDDNSKNFDNMINNCVIPNVKLLRSTYDM